MKTIPNVYDGPKPPTNLLPKQVGNAHFSLDFAASDDAAEIDAGIRESIKGVRLSILAMGMGLAKLKPKGCI